MRKPVVFWRPEWDALAGTKPDTALAKELGVSRKSVEFQRVRLKIPRYRGKQDVRCAYCGKKLRRKHNRKGIRCNKCCLVRDLEWVQNHKALRDASRDRYLATHGKARRAYEKIYRETHKEHRRIYERAWYARKKRIEAKRNAAVLASLPCLECGMLHSDERRASILRRLLPMTVHEIREAWSCIWGPADEQGTAGEARIYRDLRALGAVRVSGTWLLRQDAEVAA